MSPRSRGHNFKRTAAALVRRLTSMQYLELPETPAFKVDESAHKPRTSVLG